MILENKELDNICKLAMNSKDLYWSESSQYLTDLYNTGCRSKEPLDTSKWTMKGNDYELVTSKTEFIRIIPSTIMSNSFNESFLFGKPPYGGLSYNQLTHDFRRVSMLHPIFAGNRIADTYLYRYNRARLMFDNNIGLDTIMDFFGWKSPQIASQYIIRRLEYLPNFDEKC